ncbi:MAG: hypothetical protein NT055_03360 [Nitrospirae bacterium]|nr:hypothetical protein [Nitrospirota bacterium]
MKKAIFWLVILALLVYSGFQFGIPYYRYTAFKTDAKAIARISLGEVEKTRAQIFLRAQELNIPIEEKEIMVTRTDKLVRVKASWSESVNLFGIYQKTLNFTVNIQE